MASQQEISEVEALLGRKPQGQFEVALRTADGTPMVLVNYPLLDDGRPMPTRYWLVDKDLVKAIGRIESTGGVNQAEAAVDPDELRACHDQHNKERDALLPPDYEGPTPTGGVGGTRVGVKCLHAHYANYLVGAQDPVGRWVHERLKETGDDYQPAGAANKHAGFDHYGRVSTELALSGPSLIVDLGATSTLFVLGSEGDANDVWEADLTGSALESAYLVSDPPTAAELSAALSIVELHVTDVLREVDGIGAVLDSMRVVATGDALLIAAVEAGIESEEVSNGTVVQTKDIEDLFRTVTAEPLTDLVHNPGLPEERAPDFVGTMCVLVETLRQLGAEELRIARGSADPVES